MFRESGYKNRFLRDILLAYIYDYTMAYLYKALRNGGWLDEYHTVMDILHTVQVEWLELMQDSSKMDRWFTSKPDKVMSIITVQIITGIFEYRRQRSMLLAPDVLPEDLLSKRDSFQLLDDRMAYEKLWIDLKTIYDPQIGCFREKYHGFIKELLGMFDLRKIERFVGTTALLCLMKKHTIDRIAGMFIYHFYRVDVKDFINERIYQCVNRESIKA